MNIPSPYLTTKEAADYLRVHHLTLGRWALQGKIVPGRVGKNLVFTKDQLDDFVKVRK